MSHDATLTAGDGPSLPHLPASRTIGDYDLLEEIARGGMGVVFKARQRSLNRIVALKMILSGQFASATQLQRFRQEAEAAAHLDHPNILPIYEVGEHEGQAYFSMKLAEGGSLSDHMATVRSDVRGAIRLLEQIARGVHHAHQRGILHRDIKPANILLADAETPGAPSVPVIADFGLAKRTEGDSTLTQSGAIVGTPSYMAPEQARGSKAITTAVDTYALGAILYELLTGKPPFRGDGVAQTLRMVENEEPVRPRNIDASVDADLEAVALKCLEKDPALRYETAGSLADELAAWSRGEPVTARRAGWTRRAKKWVRRNPTVTALSGIIVLVLIAGIVVSTLYALHADRKATEARNSEFRARLQETEVLRREASLQDSLATSDYQRARALRLAARPGWRAKSLELLAKAAAIRTRTRGDDDPPAPADWPAIADLRSEAVMALVAEDARELRTLSFGMRSPVVNEAGSRMVTISIETEETQYVGRTVDLPTGEPMCTRPFKFDAKEATNSPWILFIEALDGTGRVACLDPSAAGRVDIRDFMTGKVAVALPGSGGKNPPMPEWVRFSADGKLLLAGRRYKEKAELVAWDIANPGPARVIDRREIKSKGTTSMRASGFPVGEYRSARFAPDSRRVAFVSADSKQVLVRDAKGAGKEIAFSVEGTPMVIAWHPKLPRLAVLGGGTGLATLSLYDLDAAKVIARRELSFILPTTAKMAEITFSRDGTRLAAVADEALAAVHVFQSDSLNEGLKLIEPSLIGIAGLFWTANDELIVSHHLEDLRVYRLDREALTTSIPGFRPMEVTACSRDGRWLAAYAPTSRENDQVSKTSTPSGPMRQRLSIASPSSIATPIASPAGCRD